VKSLVGFSSLKTESIQNPHIYRIIWYSFANLKKWSNGYNLRPFTQEEVGLKHQTFKLDTLYGCFTVAAVSNMSVCELQKSFQETKRTLLCMPLLGLQSFVLDKVASVFMSAREKPPSEATFKSDG